MGVQQPIFVNAGRGNVISETTVLTAIRQQWIGGAVLDVFADEPLPPTSELWDAPNVLITPHVAAMTAMADSADVFMHNYDRFIKGQPMKYTVDWDRMY